MADQRSPSPDRLQNLLTGQGVSGGGQVYPAPSAAPPETPPPPEPEQSPDPEPAFGVEDITIPGAAYVPFQPEPEYLIAEWVADSRVHRPRSREYYSSLAVIVLLLSLILFFAGQTLLIFVLLAFLFVSFVLAATKPIPMVHQVTTYGIRYQGKLYFWSQLGRFWVRDNHGTPELHIEAPTFIGRELILLGSNAQSQTEVRIPDLVEVMRLYLINEEPPMTQVDRWIRWLEEKFPLESVGRSTRR